MSASGVVDQAYCTACGSPMLDGACSGSCNASASTAPAAAPAPAAATVRAATPVKQVRRHPPTRTTTLVLALVAVLLAAASVVLVTKTQDRLDRTAADLETTRQQLAATRRQLQAAQAEQDAAAGRLTALESEVGGQPDIPATAKAASRSVFTIKVADGSGSGFALGHGGQSRTLVTNFHVVAQTYVNGGRTVEVARGKATYTGRITDVSESNDLALITVSERLPALRVADRRPAIGEPVLALGSPLGLGGTVTSGIVSAFRTEDGLDYLQFSAPISPGNSGGPVVNENGEVVGVAVWKMVAQGAEGLGFAIPTTRLCSGLDVC